MNIDNSLIKSLNHWGGAHNSLIKVASNDFVYLVILLSAVWFFNRIFQTHRIRGNFKNLATDLVIKGLIIFVIPVGVSTLVSELISMIYVRSRPFVAVPGVHLLVPHGADGGMPSHHMVFMVSGLTMIYAFNKNYGATLLVLTVASGIARISAGIHYPSDILAGLFIGWLISTSYLVFLRRRYPEVIKI